MSRLVALFVLGLCGVSFAEEPLGRYKKSHDAALIAQLEAIGYLDGVESAPIQTGVTIHTDEAWAGLNLYASGHAPEAVLMDMDGNTVHTWRKPFAEVWPTDRTDVHEHHWWRRVHLLPGGELLAIFESKGIIKLDRDSNLIWSHRGREHHDLEVLDDGSIVTLTRQPRAMAKGHRADDHVAWLSPDGELLREISILSAVERSRPDLVELFPDTPDVLHTNSIRVLKGGLANPAFARGNVLMSFRTISAVAVLDPNTETIVWAHRGAFEEQHDPRPIDARTLLLFDNHPSTRKSRAVEVDIVTGEEVWAFGGTPDSAFYSGTCGAIQRLPNGHTVVTASDTGRAFEVTRDGRIVWEFISPHRADSDPSLVATLMEVERLPKKLAWLPQ